MTRLEHIDFEVLFVAAERDPGREIQAALEDRNLESRGGHNALAAVRIEQRGVVRTDWICHGRRVCSGRQRQRGDSDTGQEQRSGDRA